MTNPGPVKVDNDPAVELYTLEYKVAAERYENIYKAIWQQFSYMSALAAGIVAFGTKSGDATSALFLAGLPLLFWFYASYLPMDHYARQARRRAGEIEGLLSKRLKLGSGEEPPTPPPAGDSPDPDPAALSTFPVWCFIACLLIALASGLDTTVSLRFRLLIAFCLSGLLAYVAGSQTVVSGTPDNPEVSEIAHFRRFGSDDPEAHWGRGRLARYVHVNQIVISVFALLTLVWVGSFPNALLAFGRDTAPPSMRFAQDSPLSIRMITDSNVRRETRDLLTALDGQSLVIDSLRNELRRLICLQHKDPGCL